MQEKDKENEDVEDEAVEETVTSEGLHILSLKLLPLVRNLQSKHGLRHGDYQRYRGYCSRRLARLRKVLKLVQVLCQIITVTIIFWKIDTSAILLSSAKLFCSTG